MPQQNKRSTIKTAAMILLPCAIASLSACKTTYITGDESGCQSILAHGITEIYYSQGREESAAALANWFCKADLSVQANIDAAVDISGALAAIFGDSTAEAQINANAQAYQQSVCQAGVNYNSSTGATWELQIDANEALLDQYEECWAQDNNEVKLVCSDDAGNNPAKNVREEDGHFVLNFHPEGEGLNIDQIRIEDMHNVELLSDPDDIPDKIIASTSTQHGNATLSLKLIDPDSSGSLVVRSNSDTYGALDCGLIVKKP